MNKSGEKVSQPPRFQMRAATDDDFPFARSLYIESMEPLLSALGAWDAEKADNAFQSYYISDEIEIVCLDGKDVGWIQISVVQNELCLDQIHLIEEVRGKGIGTKLIGKVIAEADSQGRDVSLSLVKGNPSLALYKRLGFSLQSEDETKFHMLRRSANKGTKHAV